MQKQAGEMPKLRGDMRRGSPESRILISPIVKEHDLFFSASVAARNLLKINLRIC